MSTELFLVLVAVAIVAVVAISRLAIASIVGMVLVAAVVVVSVAYRVDVGGIQRAMCPKPIYIQGTLVSCTGRMPTPDPTVRP